jgi:hypothetical protein
VDCLQRCGRDGGAQFVLPFWLPSDLPSSLAGRLPACRQCSPRGRTGMTNCKTTDGRLLPAGRPPILAVGLGLSVPQGCPEPPRLPPAVGAVGSAHPRGAVPRDDAPVAAAVGDRFRVVVCHAHTLLNVAAHRQTVASEALRSTGLQAVPNPEPAGQPHTSGRAADRALPAGARYSSVVTGRAGEVGQ